MSPDDSCPYQGPDSVMSPHHTVAGVFVTVALDDLKKKPTNVLDVF